MSDSKTSDAAPKKQLTLFDSTCIIVGIIIGTGIYRTAPDVAGCAPHVAGILAVWLAGGVLSLAGALCYAELASAYPSQGGDYVYLSRAYGPWAGYLFGWGQMTIIRPGTLASVALIFAEYAERLLDPAPAAADRPSNAVLYAVIAVVVLTAINVLGVREGKWTQNLLTVLKAVGLLAIFVVALAAPDPVAGATPPAPQGWNLRLAMIFVLFTYGGWSEMAYVAAEVQNPGRNFLRALVLGTSVVTVLYLLTNVAFLNALGQPRMIQSKAVAVETVAAVFPGIAARAIGGLVCISALGALNGMIFTGSRISYALGREYSAFHWLGMWSGQRGTPVWALIVQGVLTMAVVLWLRDFANTLLYTTAVVWLFYLATGLSVFVLRRRDPQLERPYKVSGHPLTTLLFCASAVFLIWAAVTFNFQGSLLAVGILLSGLPFYWLSKRRGT